ncbi:MAG: YebC/PmpR family DNA-binding transcriptional regulator [bacterium]
MSGHSKWHNIQARKGKQDAKRGNLFSKFAKKITLAAKIGGGNPETNFALRLALDKGKGVGMPKENLERAVKAGTGELKDVAQLEELLYEGFGPGGTAVMVKILTDNKNRVSSEIKRILADNGGSLGGSGSVQWMFEQFGIARINNEQLTINKIERDDFEMQMIEAGAEDISEEGGIVEIRTKIENLQSVLGKIKEMGIEPESSCLEWIAKDKVSISLEIQDKLMRLFEELEEHDDVEDYFTNAE